MRPNKGGRLSAPMPAACQAPREGAEHARQQDPRPQERSFLNIRVYTSRVGRVAGVADQRPMPAISDSRLATPSDPGRPARPGSIRLTGLARSRTRDIRSAPASVCIWPHFVRMGPNVQAGPGNPSCSGSRVAGRQTPRPGQPCSCKHECSCSESCVPGPCELRDPANPASLRFPSVTARVRRETRTHCSSS